MGKMFRLCSAAVAIHSLVKDTAANTVGPLASDTEKIRGIAENACTNSGDPVIVTVNGVTTLAKNGSAVTDLHYIIPDVSDPTKGADAGTTSIGSISTTARPCCKAVASALAGDSTVLVDVLEVRFGAMAPIVETVSWTFGNQAPVVVGDAVLTPWIAAGTESIGSCFIAAGTSPTGADLIVQATKNGSNAFTATLPAGTANNTNVTITPTATTLAKGDILKASLTQVGSTLAGQNVMLKCVFNVTAW
jgi:hypothetical protein